MIKKMAWIASALAVIVLASAPGARADGWNDRTALTFSRPVEIPGHVLPAGTYTFKVADWLSDRYIVQVFNADGSQILATVLAIPQYRHSATDQTVIKFDEVAIGAPEAIRAWFNRGEILGQEFVYPKNRAAQLAMASQVVVPAMAVDDAAGDDLKTVTIVVVIPGPRAIPLTEATQDRSSSIAGTTGVARTGRSACGSARELTRQRVCRSSCWTAQ